ncbi:hypothetical protein FF2_022102 [Malus domestica]
MHFLALKPRLQRLYISTHTTSDMRWHKDRWVDNDVMRHHADREAWKEFDQLYPKFSREPRNVRLGLMIDWFNPFGVLNQYYNTWPTHMGMCIDVYLQPLVDELKELWENGVPTYDKSTGKMFILRAVLM